MARTRIAPLAAVVLGSLALAGCVISPPALPTQTTPTASEPVAQPSSTPATSEPAATSPAPTPTDAAPAAGSSTLTIDGQPVGDWGTTLSCYSYGDGALISTSSEDESGSIVASGENAGGTWTVVGVLMSSGDDVYFQSADSDPASYDGTTFSAEFGMTDFSGSTVTVAFSVPC